MRKLLCGAFILMMLMMSAGAAEILSVQCNKEGVMKAGDGANRADELYEFRINATADTQKVMMEGMNGNIEIATNDYVGEASDTVWMTSIKLTSGLTGLRNFKFWAVDKDGNETEFKDTVQIMCFDYDDSEITVYSAELKNNIIRQNKTETHHDEEKIEVTVCTSVNTKDFMLISETGKTTANLAQHCLERGGCNIINGRKYWTVYFVSNILGERTLTFQALDFSGNPIGDKKSVSFTVYEEKEYELVAPDSIPGGGTGNTGDSEKGDSKPGSEGENAGDGNSDSADCCEKENFVAIKCPADSATVVIKMPDGGKINAEDMVKKDLATVDKNGDGSKTYTVWVNEGIKKDELDITVYDEDYTPAEGYELVDVADFDEDEIEALTKAIKNEIRIKENPNQTIIKLQINNEFMYVNGEKLEVDPGRGTSPIIMNERTMLPVRVIIEKLGGTVSWDGDTKKVSINIFDKDINLWIGKDKIVTNNIPAKMDTEAVIINDRTMLPIRYVAECIDHTDVEWEDATKTVTITYNY